MPGQWVVLHHGPAGDRWAWSGIPHGLAEALAEDVDARRVSVDLPLHGESLGRRIGARLGVSGYQFQGATAPMIAARDLRLRCLPEVRGADVAVAMGTTFGLSFGSSRPGIYATFEDCTVAQSQLPDSALKRSWQARQRRVYESADICFAATPWVANSMAVDYGVPRSKICVTGLGLNVRCRPAKKDFSRPRLLWVGVDWARKGGAMLVEAFERAAIPGATLDLVGRHPVIDRPGVVGHGVIRDEARLRSLFEQATLFVLPSSFEAFGMVFLEAASAGTPTLGTAVGGIPFAIGASGETVAPNDLDALVDGLVRMTDPVRAASYAPKAAAHVADHGWPSVAGRMLHAVAGVTSS